MRNKSPGGSKPIRNHAILKNYNDQVGNSPT